MRTIIYNRNYLFDKKGIIKELRSFAEQQGWIVEEVCCDNHYSAFDDTRPGYRRMLNRVKKKDVDIILVPDLTRLTRSGTELVKLYNELSMYGAKIFNYSMKRFC